MNKKIKDYIKDKTILVTGGTGSFGEFLTRELLAFEPKKIIIFSRDEWKQHELKRKLADYKSILDFCIGDVRNFDALLVASRNVDIIYHAAAMKHVSISEENPMEAVYTNIYGAYNLKEAAIRNKVGSVIAISTDKAVRSVNVMGMTKAIQERILLANHKQPKTRFICVRFGNVVGSRGSVVPLFKEALEHNEPILLTDPKMTRFLISLDDAMELIFTATLEGQGREIFVKKMPVCQIYDMAKVMIKNMKNTEIKNYPVRIIGLREGEQLHETLVSEEEMSRAKESVGYFVIYPYGTTNLPKMKSTIGEYRTDLFKDRMQEDEIEKVLKMDGWI